MARELMVRLVGDSRSLERAYAKAEASSKRFNRTMTAQNQSTAASFQAIGVNTKLLGGVGALAIMKQSVDAASDLNEQMNRSRVVFGSSADAVEKWSATLADGFGVSRREALKAAGDFGTMFQTIGLADKPAADMSRRLVELGADMASFGNADPSDMLDRLRSGLAGEAEPLRRFGVLLSEARVKTEAYRSGIARQGATLTEQQKVQARYNLILQDTIVQQGDAKKTAGEFAGQMRRLNAQVDDLESGLGTTLLPSLTSTVGMLSDGAKAAGLFADQLNRIPSGGSLTTGIGGAWDKFKDFLAKNPFGIGKPYGGGPASVNPAVNPNALGPPRPSNLAALAAATKKPAASAGVSADQRNQWFDAMIGRELVDVQDVATAKGQIARLQEISAQVTARLKVTTDITRKLTLEDQLKEIARQRRGLQVDLAAKVAADAKDAAAKLVEAKRAAVQESFGWLDLAVARTKITATIKDDLRAYADQEAAIRAQIRVQGQTLELETQLFTVQQERARTIAEQAEAQKRAAADRKKAADDARRQATETRMGWLDFAIEQAEATKGKADDFRALRNREAFLKTLIAHEGRTLELVSELWRTRQKIADLNKSKADPLAGLMQVSSKKLAQILSAGTGLNARGQARLGANIAGAEIQPMHVHVNIDGREVGRAVTTQQARTGNRTGHQTSGRRG